MVSSTRVYMNITPPSLALTLTNRFELPHIHNHEHPVVPSSCSDEENYDPIAPPMPPSMLSMDVCFMLDATGSMGEYIEEMKNKVVAMTRIMQEANPGLTMRLACIGKLSNNCLHVSRVFEALSGLHMHICVHRCARHGRHPRTCAVSCNCMRTAGPPCARYALTRGGFRHACMYSCRFKSNPTIDASAEQAWGCVPHAASMCGSFGICIDFARE